MRTVAPALLASFLFASAAHAQTAWADKLFSGDTTHDFGVVPRGAQLKYSFKMTNIYKEPLEITQVRISCQCTSFEHGIKVLQPGQTGEFHVKMDGRQFTGPKTVRVFVTVGPKFISTATLTVSANARQDVVFNPGEIDFGNVARGQTPTKQIEVEYAGALNWKVEEIVKNSTAPFDLKVEVLPQPVGQSGRKGYRILATLKPDAPAGPFKQEVVVKTNDAASPSIGFHVVGNVQSGLIVSPATLSVSGLRVGESQTKKVVLRGQHPFRVLGVDGAGEGVKVEFPEREDATMILTVSIQPNRAGDMRRQITIRTDHGKETATITIDGDVAP